MGTLRSLIPPVRPTRLPRVFLLGRFVPLIGYGLALYELYNEFNEWYMRSRYMLPSGWVREANCGGEEPNNFNGSYAAGICINYTQYLAGDQFDINLYGRTANFGTCVKGPECQYPYPAGKYWFKTAWRYRRASGTTAWGWQTVMPAFEPSLDLDDYWPWSGDEYMNPPEPYSDDYWPWSGDEYEGTPPRVDPRWKSIPEIFPQVDPWMQPGPGVARPVAQPVPFEFVPALPTVSPVDEPIRGPGPGEEAPEEPGVVDVPTVYPEPEDDWPYPYVPPALPAPRELPWAPPGQVPAQRVTFEPGKPPLHEPDARHVLRPPYGGETEKGSRGKREKETKLKPTSAVAGRALWWAINQATEACDLVDVFYKALPLEIRRKYERSLAAKGRYSNWLAFKNNNDPLRQSEKYNANEITNQCSRKLQLVWKFQDRVDMEKAIENFVNEAAGDIFRGRASQATNPVSKAMRRGIMLGGWDNPPAVVNL